ncbi:MAG: hypothetical protein HYU36_10230 [Planctomycetes bacterium]|nr:hypothetical protein [Planctomycetota bacterium]
MERVRARVEPVAGHLRRASEAHPEADWLAHAAIRSQAGEVGEFEALDPGQDSSGMDVEVEQGVSEEGHSVNR